MYTRLPSVLYTMPVYDVKLHHMLCTVHMRNIQRDIFHLYQSFNSILYNGWV